VLGLISVVLHPRNHPTTPSLERLSTNDVANRYFDLGRVYFERGTNMQVAVDYWTKSIQADANFAEAYAYLAFVYQGPGGGGWNPGWVFLPKAKAYAEQALNLNKSLALPHVALGWYYAMHEWDWTTAQEHYDLAIKLEPQEPYCRRSHAEFLKVIGRTGEAVSEMREAGRLVHRRWGWVNMRLIAMLIAHRKWDDAVRESDFAIAMDPRASAPHAMRSIALAAKQEYAEAIDAERQERVLNGEAEEKVDHDVAELKRSFNSKGPAVAYWEFAFEQAKKGRQGPYWEARSCAQFDKEQSVELLQKALSERDPMLTFHVMTDFAIDPLRTDPRFHVVLRAMHLDK
jgi:serine/threonine-protein kinase